MIFSIELKMGNSGNKSLLSATPFAVRRELFTLSILNLLPKLFELMLFRCVSFSLSMSLSQTPLLRMSILGPLLFFLHAFIVSLESYRDACDATACEAKDHH